ncbi:MAG: NAD(P)H-dependent oxidoreductase [Thermoguttaceae bacterium]|nr:NAD(P)H-dependent oxidoreductase [Thermoguttaceae bacterium]
MEREEDRVLIAFFSRADENYFNGKMKYVKVGNTEIAVNKIKELVKADVFKINMKKPYSPAYLTCIEEAKKDLEEQARPELTKYVDSVDEYDVVILAYPNYWGTVPMAVATFLERYDFSGKPIMPLCTNEGSGMGTSERDIQKYAPDATLLTGLSIRGGDVEESGPEIKAWLLENGVNLKNSFKKAR